MSDPWCSSGGLSSNGDLISTGGFKEGIRSIRIMNPCDNCEFQENANGLAAMRWYNIIPILFFKGFNSMHYPCILSVHLKDNVYNE